MALTFTAFAAVATAGGGWVVRANQYGRAAALIVLAVFGLSLLWPALSDRISRPFVQMGSRLAASSNSNSNPGTARSLLRGMATRLLWAPCAGPILGLVLTGAALEGASARTVFLLLACSAGAATSLAVALLAGGCSLRSSAHCERKSGYAASWALPSWRALRRLHLGWTADF
jgi:cytochrome c biogenesis protein CcdA